MTLRTDIVRHLSLPLIFAAVIASFYYQGESGFGALLLVFALLFAAVALNYYRLLSNTESVSLADVWLLLFVLWCLLGYFWSFTPSVTLLNIPLFVIFLIGAYLGRGIGMEQLPLFLNILIAIISLLALYPLYQFLYLHIEKPPGLFINPNMQATVLNFAILPLAARYLHGNHRGTGQKLLLLIPLLLLFSTILIISSRAAFLSLIVGISFLVIYLRGRALVSPLLQLVVALSICFAAINALQDRGIADRLVSMSQQQSVDVASGNRLRIWKPALALITEKPLLGYGIGGFWTAYQPVRPADDSSSGRYVHNDYLQFLLDTGVIGLVLFLLFWFTLLRRSTLQLFSSPVCDDGVNRAGVTAALLGILVHALFSFPLYVTSTLLLSGLYIGLLLNRQPPFGSPALARGSRVVSVALMLPFLYLLVTLFIADRMLKSSTDATTTDQAMKTIARAEGIYPYWDQPPLYYAYYTTRAMNRDRSILRNKVLIDFLLRKLREGLERFPQRPENYYYQAELMRYSVPQYPQQQIVDNYRTALAYDPGYLPARNAMATYYITLNQPQTSLEILEQGWGRFYYTPRESILTYLDLLGQLRRRHQGTVALADINRVQRMVIKRSQLMVPGKDTVFIK